MDALLTELNPAQRESVLHGDGPVLVLAGAGSGKTRVLTHRIAHLVRARGVDASRIFAVTFTNKAAGEMRERVAALLEAEGVTAWIGTFHALCLRVLRRHGARVGLQPGFAVFDTADQISIVKQILKADSAADDVASARPILSRISRAKNALERPEEMAARAFSATDRLAARVWERYETALRSSNGVDFDDLLLRSLELFREHDDVRRQWASSCEHLLVDEFQDTNRPQYLLVRALASVHGNVFVVGDEDQSIYRFRGADIRNILGFERDHPTARVLKLEQNYRSSGTILEAAGAVISRNRSRKGKTLWTQNERGGKVDLCRASDDRTEANWVSRTIRNLAREIPYERIAVLYRTNAQSRQFEEVFRRDIVPHQLVGSVQFYERKEVRDLLAYLKLIANPLDEPSFRRIANVPTRGVGDGTMKTIEEMARERGISLASAADAVVAEARVSPKSARAVRGFLELIAGLRSLAATTPPADVLRAILREAAYQDYIEASYPGQGSDRMDNVRALVSAAVEFENEVESPTVEGFLERSALVQDADDVGRGPGVTLMTIHCAKGLEFAAVFLVGLEENLFPHARSAEDPDAIEEERRLCYVAMTRARERLFLSHAAVRLFQGVPTTNGPSRFLDEIPPDLVDETSSTPSDLLAERPAWRSDGDPWKGSSAARAARDRKGSAARERAVALEKDPGDGFPVGAMVVHPLFGSGQIMDREGSGKSLKLTIRFARHGSKKILPAYTALTVETAGSGKH